MESIMSFSSTLQVLKVNPPASGVSKKTGQPWERHTAECMLLDDSGAIQCVGRLVIPKALVDQVKEGTFRASFALEVPTYGDSKGDITTRLVGLMAAPAPKSFSASAAAAGRSSTSAV